MVEFVEPPQGYVDAKVVILLDGSPFPVGTAMLKQPGRAREDVIQFLRDVADAMEDQDRADFLRKAAQVTEDARLTDAEQ